MSYIVAVIMLIITHGYWAALLQFVVFQQLPRSGRILFYFFPFGGFGCGVGRESQIRALPSNRPNPACVLDPLPLLSEGYQ